MEPFNLDQALFAAAMENIAGRARQRRFEAIHDGLLILGSGISMTIAAFGAAWLYLLFSGRV